jgi:hypothetical protein
MGQISKIVKAWWKVVEGATTEEQKKRAKICSGCKLAEHKKYLDWINDDLNEVNGMVCGLCNCPLVAKIRSNDKCPKSLW